MTKNQGENCAAWKAEADRLRSNFTVPATSDEPFTANDIITHLEFHRMTHIDWASWFESHPNDPRISSVGSAEFHRAVACRYDRMIAGVRYLVYEIEELRF